MPLHLPLLSKIKGTAGMLLFLPFPPSPPDVQPSFQPSHSMGFISVSNLGDTLRDLCAPWEDLSTTHLLFFLELSSFGSCDAICPSFFPLPLFPLFLPWVFAWCPLSSTSSLSCICCDVQLFQNLYLEMTLSKWGQFDLSWQWLDSECLKGVGYVVPVPISHLCHSGKKTAVGGVKMSDFWLYSH